MVSVNFHSYSNEEVLEGYLNARVNGNTFTVYRLYVEPEHRRKGVGSSLLSLIPKHLDVELACIPLTVAGDTKLKAVSEAALRRFYWKNGFRNARKKVLSNLLRRKGKK